MIYKIGLDVGSTTAKMAVLNETDDVVWQRYERHQAQVKPLLKRYLAEVADVVGNDDVTIAVTGSVGMQTAELLGAPFVQEVVAASVYVRRRHPEAQALIDIGGEDSKVVLLTGGHADLRMNGNCAGGTGAFIDQMAALLGFDHGQMNALALQSTEQHTIAARCGVFAKTDVQNLVSQGVKTADICASIFHSIAVQTITTLAHGQRISPPVMLCGGPLTFLSALRKAFAEYLQTDEQDFIVGNESNLIPAIGTAMQGDACPVRLGELQQRLEKTMDVKVHSSLPPLFANDEEYCEWQLEKERQGNVEVKPMQQGREQVVIGIDSGSTTTKIIAARPNGDILFSHYAASLGHPVQAVAEGLERLKKAAGNTEIEVIGSCATGYGEELIKAAFNLDDGIIETMAHYRAASRLMPEVSFILDIGGQDMKAIFVDRGVVTRMELNEACSSGCGTFLQTFAENLNHSIGDFAREACTAKHPCDLGTRCTVFMNSKVKQVLRQGAEVSDIAAGLSYSVVNNCLYKVLKLKDSGELGKQIVVQGGTMRNDAVVRALELLTGHTVARSNMPEMMGAYGCALYAASHKTEPRKLEQLTSCAKYETRQSQCKGCENHCTVNRYRFAGGRNYVSGNKCERIFTNSGHQQQKGQNIYPEKYRLLFSGKGSPLPSTLTPRKIGIPRVLNFYENYPFWHRLLTDCGMEVTCSSESKMQHYECALSTVMSDNICFPAKLVHSHIAELVQLGVDRILMPYVVYEQQESKTATNSFNCPIVTGYSDVIRSAMPTQIPIDSPVLNFANVKLLKRQIADFLHGLGIDKQTAVKAFCNAWTAKQHIEEIIRQRAEEILADSREHGRLAILLAGRPYHTDPLIQHRISDTIAAMGVNVISDDIVRMQCDQPDGETNTVRQWAYVNRIIKAAQWVATSAPDVQFVQLTSFGCGPDAFIQDEVRSLLARHGKTYTLLKIDDVTNVGSLKLRVRSLIESLQNQRLQHTTVEVRHLPFQTTRIYTQKDEGRTILVPHISEFVTPLLPTLGRLAGYHIEVLPPSDGDSATAGLQYANNEVCYPATLIVGDIINALQSGRYDTKNIAIAMSQTGGQCRATNYAGLIKRAMVQTGFSHVPLITLGVTTNGDGANEQEGFRISWRKIGPAVLSALLYADTIAKMYYAAAAREEVEGQAAELRDRYLQMGADTLLNTRRHITRNLTRLVADACADFNAITRDMPTQKVGIVGEIFLKFNHFAHQQIHRQLMQRGVEIVPPLIAPFFLQEFVNVVQNKRLGLTESHIPTALVNLLCDLSQRNIRRFNRAAANFRYFTPFDDIRHEALRTEGIVSPAAQFGEGWLLPAEISAFAEHGINNVLSLQPFGCIANHIVAKGVENALRRRYPDLNLLSIDFDSGVSAVNITNRLLLFLSAAQ